MARDSNRLRGGLTLASFGQIDQSRLLPNAGAAMKNYFEMQGQACRLIFNPPTDECCEGPASKFVAAILKNLRFA
jgi:hypothetical protein